MADYPDIDQTYEGETRVRANLSSQVTESGLVRARDLGGARRRVIEVSHIADEASWQLILALYRQKQSALGNAPFSFDSQKDGMTYTVRFGAEPHRQKLAGDVYRIGVQLVE